MRMVAIDGSGVISWTAPVNQPASVSHTTGKGRRSASTNVPERPDH